MQEFIPEAIANLHRREAAGDEAPGRVKAGAQGQFQGLEFAAGKVMAELGLHRRQSGVEGIGEGLLGRLSLAEQGGQLPEIGLVRGVSA